MRIAIIGTDPRAVALGRLFAGAGHQLCFADASGRTEAAKRAAAEVGASAKIPYDAATACELLVFTGTHAQMHRAARAIGRMPPENVVLDVMEGPVRGARSGAEQLARILDTHRVVRGLLLLAQPGANVPLCGDDPDAVTLVERLLRECGCVTTDRGPLANAAEIEAPKPSHAA
ncbi:MAG TPA: NAD(P)-binding domain-containing protein [Verrucomicrobiae bacterium]|nr:NAD(P)-binding domain-containing protein [Verrucomicrobiae bacterium]